MRDLHAPSHKVRVGTCQTHAHTKPHVGEIEIFSPPIVLNGHEFELGVVCPAHTLCMHLLTSYKFFLSMQPVLDWQIPAARFFEFLSLFYLYISFRRSPFYDSIPLQRTRPVSNTEFLMLHLSLIHISEPTRPY